jgi:predicted nucleotidyltransferase
MTRAENVDAIGRELADGLRRLYGPKLRELILYGSWARGDAREDSDIDFLVVLDDYEGFSKELWRIVEVSAEVGLKHDVHVSTQPISCEEYARNREPFLRNVRAEGKRVA